MQNTLAPVKDRNQFWATTFARPSFKANQFLDKPYCKGLQLDSNDFDSINEVIYEIVFNSMDAASRQTAKSSKNREAILEQLNQTTSFSIAMLEQIDTFVELERRVLAAFNKLGVLEALPAVQFPMDIRVVHPEAPPKYLEKRDAIDYMHTDSWRGEPPDIVNVVLYNHVTDDCSHLVVLDVPPGGIDVFASYTGEEKEALPLYEHLPELDIAHRDGAMYLFDAYNPHRTKRNGNSVRISLNFSFRRNDPYSTLDEKWDRPRQPWSKYWLTNVQRAKSFEERCQLELSALNTRPEAQAWRKTTIDKWLAAGKPWDTSYAN